MKAYQINDLERLTGIKAHTIRIWEKRYGLISPNRTDTNRRYYDDDQVKRLLNVATLVASGHKISKIAAYSDGQLHEYIEAAENYGDASSSNIAFVNDMISSMLVFDEAAFEKVFSAAVLRMGFYETVVNVVYPFLIKTGVLWTTDKSVPAQEHFASCIIRRKLMAATDGLLPATNTSRCFLLFLPPSEWHEVGLMFANYIIRANGFPTVYLGQNVPTEGVAQVWASGKPTHLVTFFTAPRPDEEISFLLRSYSRVAASGSLLAAVADHSRLKLKMGNLSFLDGISSLDKWLK